MNGQTKYGKAIKLAQELVTEKIQELQQRFSSFRQTKNESIINNNDLNEAKKRTSSGVNALPKNSPNKNIQSWLNRLAEIDEILKKQTNELSELVANGIVVDWNDSDIDKNSRLKQMMQDIVSSSRPADEILEDLGTIEREMDAMVEGISTNYEKQIDSRIAAIEAEVVAESKKLYDDSNGKDDATFDGVKVNPSWTDNKFYGFQ